MEVAGLAIGAGGLLTLFDACLRGFDLFEQGKDFSRDHTILMTRLDAQRAIFTIWGSAVGLTTVNGIPNAAAIPLDAQLSSLVHRHLECISLIFEDAARLSEKYGMKPRKRSIFWREWSTAPASPLRSYLSWFQKQTSRRKKAIWVIRDFSRFKNMLDDLSHLISELREITSSIADIRRQREVFIDGLAQCTDIKDLEIIEEALSEEDPELSAAASDHRTALTENAMTDPSFPKSVIPRSRDDDMQTHADTDPNAQAMSLDTDTTKANVVDDPFDDGEGSSEVFAKYGHQNNLSEIQKDDMARIHLFTTGQVSQIEAERIGMSQLAARRVRHELQGMQTITKETPFISLGLADRVGSTPQLNRLIGKIQAPTSTPYEGGVFFISIEIPNDYPYAPPRFQFITPVYHPNIDTLGNICLDILEPKFWGPFWDLENILTAICSLLGSPNYKDAIMPQIAKQFLHDQPTFNAQARLHTQRHAVRQARKSDHKWSGCHNPDSTDDHLLKGLRSRFQVEEKNQSSSASNSGASLSDSIVDQESVRQPHPPLSWMSVVRYGILILVTYLLILVVVNPG